MRAMVAAAGLLGAFWLPIAPVWAASCPNEADALGVARIVEIDVAGGPLFGDISRRRREPNFLKPKEVVLTFDDGPYPRITKSILDTLDRFCTKATFFAVGQMALTYPGIVRDVLNRGHTLGAHTWSHPLNLNRLKLENAKTQIERGFAAVALAAGRPIAPFFRFPGLSDSRRLLSYLQGRGVGSFTVDVVSEDSFISSPARLSALTLRRIERNGGGIVLFHDIKAATAKALPRILSALKNRGYKVVHLRAKADFKPLKRFDAKLSPILAKALKRLKNKESGESVRAAAVLARLMPFYGTIGPGKYATLKDIGPPVTALSPPPRARTKVTTGKRSSDTGSTKKTSLKSNPDRGQGRGAISGPFLPTRIEGEDLRLDLPGL